MDPMDPDWDELTANVTKNDPSSFKGRQAVTNLLSNYNSLDGKSLQKALSKSIKYLMHNRCEDDLVQKFAQQCKKQDCTIDDLPSDMDLGGLIGSTIRTPKLTCNHFRIIKQSGLLNLVADMKKINYFMQIIFKTASKDVIKSVVHWADNHYEKHDWIRFHTTMLDHSSKTRTWHYYGDSVNIVTQASTMAKDTLDNVSIAGIAPLLSSKRSTKIKRGYHLIDQLLPHKSSIEPKAATILTPLLLAHGFEKAAATLLNKTPGQFTSEQEGQMYETLIDERGQFLPHSFCFLLEHNIYPPEDWTKEVKNAIDRAGLTDTVQSKLAAFTV